MSMKLTGEYEFTNDGVRIIGKIHDTRISLVRKKLEGRNDQEMYLGEGGPMYWVPDAQVYSTLKAEGKLNAEAVAKVLNLPKDYDIMRMTALLDLQMAGIQYRRAGGTQLMQSLPLAYNVRGSTYQRRRVKRPQFNVAWIYAIEEDGSFDMTLKGMVNRHILTMLLGRASTFAKYLDGPVAEAVL